MPRINSSSFNIKETFDDKRRLTNYNYEWHLAHYCHADVELTITSSSEKEKGSNCTVEFTIRNSASCQFEVEVIKDKCDDFDSMTFRAYGDSEKATLKKIFELFSKAFEEHC